MKQRILGLTIFLIILLSISATCIFFSKKPEKSEIILINPPASQQYDVPSEDDHEDEHSDADFVMP